MLSSPRVICVLKSCFAHGLVTLLPCGSDQRRCAERLATASGWDEASSSWRSSSPPLREPACLISAWVRATRVEVLTGPPPGQRHIWGRPECAGPRGPRPGQRGHTVGVFVLSLSEGLSGRATGSAWTLTGKRKGSGGMEAGSRKEGWRLGKGYDGERWQRAQEWESLKGGKERKVLG